MESYELSVRPIPATSLAAPTVDLRSRHVDMSDLVDLVDRDSWEWCREFVRRFVGGSDDRAARRLTDDTIKVLDRHRGADRKQLAAVLEALDHDRPVAVYGWWPIREAASVTDILGVDAMDVPPPDRKGSGLVEGHAVAAVGYGRHDAFPGGGYLIVRNPWSCSTWGDQGCGFVPFAYLRAYAIALYSVRTDTNQLPRDEEPPGRPSGRSRHPIDVQIAKKARCSDPRASYTDLFFSEIAIDTARAKAICARCAVRVQCLDRALERQEPYGIWGGEFFVDGAIVAVKRGRGRPRKIAPPTRVDEVTGMPVVA